MKLVVTVPGLVLKSTANLREHWSRRAKRSAEQKLLVAAALSNVPVSTRDALRGAGSVTVKYTRVGGRKMDRDNCIAALKHAHDQLSRWVGVDDKDDRFWKWEWPEQRPAKDHCLVIELTAEE